jgi:tetratricopeptide (TPR) repeat protein
MILGVGYTLNGQLREAKDTFQQAFTFYDKFGIEILTTPVKVFLGAVLIAEGHMEHGLKMIEEAQQACLENGDKLSYASCELTVGYIYLQMVDKTAPVKLTTVLKNIGFLVKNIPFAAKKAETHYNKAIEVAREIGAKGFIGQSYLGLGVLHSAKSEKVRARECLSTAIEMFEQCGIETYLKQAREALASLE